MPIAASCGGRLFPRPVRLPRIIENTTTNSEKACHRLEPTLDNHLGSASGTGNSRRIIALSQAANDYARKDLKQRLGWPSIFRRSVALLKA